MQPIESQQMVFALPMQGSPAIHGVASNLAVFPAVTRLLTPSTVCGGIKAPHRREPEGDAINQMCSSTDSLRAHS